MSTTSYPDMTSSAATMASQMDTLSNTMATSLSNLTTSSAITTTLHRTTLDPQWNFREVSESDYRSDLTIGLLSVLFILIMIGIVFGNIIVIIAILTYRTLKKQQSNLFILNLAFADLSVVLTVMIWTTVAFILDLGRDTSNPWIFTDVSMTYQ